MRYRIETWTINELYKLYKEGNLNLNPSYQRRFIWSLKDQQTLVESIINGYAVPNIFLYERGKNIFEMVDGQQRTRTILGFIDGQFKTKEGLNFEISLFKNFLSYEMAVIIIEEIDEDDDIEYFYTLVNKSGVHLNRPELKKAEYFETNFLKLVTEITESDKFSELEIFSDNNTKRMVDIDFVSELVTLLIEGNTDKKLIVDKIFESDITPKEYKSYLKSFNTILNRICEFNEIYPIKKTRYKQRNDFYSLFGFLLNADFKKSETFKYFYKSLLKFNEHISPSNIKCLPFQTYAFNCISQSNSKVARDTRLKVLNEIFLNENSTPNKTQREILKYFASENHQLIKKEKYQLIDISKI